MSERELVRIRRTGDRLRFAFRALIAALPPAARTISPMSRWLGIHKATCQRIVEGVAKSRDGLDAFDRFPGVDGLRNHITACRERRVKRDRIAAAAAAVDEYEQLLNDLDLRSTRHLLDRISEIQRAAAPMSPSQESEERRRLLFEGATLVTGEELGAKAIVALVQANPRHPRLLSETIVSWMTGIRRESHARPIVPLALMGWWTYTGASGTLSALRPPEIPHEIPSYSILSDFTTAGFRAVTLEAADARTLLVVEPSGAAPANPAEAAVEFRTGAIRNPMVDPPNRFDIAARIANPCRLLVLEVFLHESIAGACVPSLACVSFAATPGDAPGGAPDQLWHERFPHWPGLGILGRGLHECASLPRLRELAAAVFDRHSEDPADYRSFRCEVRFPIWQSDYRMYFEFPHGRDETDGPAE